ncbi:MAG: TetR/AcrR family transcriptional regulator [Actinobacteria bacterium]|nr:TetR/AcrR family transcriptional regulator [Actinomycetota bacterium]
MDDGPRGRILRATVTAIGRYGIAKTTMEDAAREAGVGRATVYRHFPGGREQLIRETITFEVARFFARLADQVAGAPDFATLLERGLRFAHRAVEEHEVLQKVVDTEPERLLPQLTESAPIVHAVLRAYLEPLLAQERLAEGVAAPEAADWLARQVLSFIVGAGRWNLDDPEQVRTLVRRHLLAGVLADAGGAPSPADPEVAVAAAGPE